MPGNSVDTVHRSGLHVAANSVSVLLAITVLVEIIGASYQSFNHSTAQLAEIVPAPEPTAPVIPDAPVVTPEENTVATKPRFLERIVSPDASASVTRQLNIEQLASTALKLDESVVINGVTYDVYLSQYPDPNHPGEKLKYLIART